MSLGLLFGTALEVGTLSIRFPNERLRQQDLLVIQSDNLNGKHLSGSIVDRIE
jgi:hypothetical protein